MIDMASCGHVFTTTDPGQQAPSLPQRRVARSANSIFGITNAPRIFFTIITAPKLSVLHAKLGCAIMEVEASPLGSSSSQDDRWNHLQTILTRSSPLAHPEFEPSEEVRA